MHAVPYPDVTIVLPAYKAPRPIKPSSKLTLRFNNLPLQYRKLDDPLAILRPDSRQPDSLRRLPSPTVLPTTFLLLNSSSPVHHNIRGKLVPAHVADEIDPDTAGPLVVHVAVEAEVPELALEFTTEEGCGLATAGVAGFLGADEDYCEVRAGPCGKGMGVGSRNGGYGWGYSRSGVVKW